MLKLTVEPTTVRPLGHRVTEPRTFDEPPPTVNLTAGRGGERGGGEKKNKQTNKLQLTGDRRAPSSLLQPGHGRSSAGGGGRASAGELDPQDSAPSRPRAHTTARTSAHARL